MKRPISTISVLSLLFFAQCASTDQLNGTYSDTKSIEFKFNDSTKMFEYFLRSEMGVLQYSKGGWESYDDKVYLLGLTDNNIKKIDVESVINKNVSSNRTHVEVHCNSDNAVTNIKSIVFINDDKTYVVAKDTVFSLDYKVEVIQVKSYLSYSGLLSSAPKIDTLYSSRINVSSESNEGKSIVLNFVVHPYDFARVKFADTLTVKNNRTLYLNKSKLIKI